MPRTLRSQFRPVLAIAACSIGALCLPACGSSADADAAVDGHVFLTTGGACGTVPASGVCNAPPAKSAAYVGTFAFFEGKGCADPITKANEFQSPGVVVLAAKTDSQGGFSVALPAGTYVVGLDPPQRANAQCVKVNAAEHATLKINLTEYVQ